MITDSESYHKKNNSLVVNKKNRYTLGMSLKEYLEKYNFTGRELAHKLGIQPSYLSMIVNCKRKPSISLLKRIINVTNGEVNLNDF